MGPLAYVVGYCLHKLYRESKNSHWNSERSQELQALLLSMKDDSASVEFVSSPIPHLITYFLTSKRTKSACNRHNTCIANSYLQLGHY